MAEVKIPPFTRGKKQLEKVDVDWSRKLSVVRIHVEHVIGKNMQNAKDTTTSTIDRIYCACVNLCPSVVPQE